MMNEIFSLLSERDRNTKLKAVLKKKTGGFLTDRELSGILANVPLGRQYCISVYWDDGTFGKILEIPENGQVQVVLGLTMSGDRKKSEGSWDHTQAAAVITQGSPGSGGVGRLHIFLPGLRLQKGRNHG